MAKYRDTQRDVMAADDALSASRLNCCAHSCPNLWSVDKGDGGMCSAHAWAKPAHWPRITDEQHALVAARAMRAAEPSREPPRLSASQKRALIRRASALLAGSKGPSLDWAIRLQEREEAGEVLNRGQREAWRTALRIQEPIRATSDEQWDEEHDHATAPV